MRATLEWLIGDLCQTAAWIITLGDAVSKEVTAVEMARAVGVDPKRFRAALRDANLSWHCHNDRWVVVEGSAQHTDMTSVLIKLLTG